MGIPRYSSSLALSLAAELGRMLARVAPPETDLDRLRRYADPPRPVEFAREVLGIELWSRQSEIVAAVASHKRVSVASGHKVGKSTALAVLAIWFYCCFPGGRVVITATTDRQVNGIIWREIKRLVRGARLTIPGASEISVRAQTGLTNPLDFSEIRGYTASEAEAIAGISAPAILYLVDEASAVKDFIFEAIEGNRAGGAAWVFMISNPTRAEGEFYESHHSKRWDPVSNPSGYLALHIDSRESPNVTGEWRQLWSKPLAGLAMPEWISEKVRDWGEEHPLFKVRVAGLFSVAEEAKIFQLEMIEEMHERWVSGAAPRTGRLYIGVDPSGDGDAGDEGAFVPRIGARVLEVRARAGISPQGYVAEIQDLIRTWAPKGELPLVIVESEGEVSWKVYRALKEHEEKFGEFEVFRVRTSERAVRQPGIYDRMRDELWANARAWARAGGAIPESVKLDKDLHAPEFYSDIRGRQKVTAKKELRKLLGRSPDSGDAFVLSCWEPLSARLQEAASQAAGASDHSDSLLLDELLDPYSALSAFR